MKPIISLLLSFVFSVGFSVAFAAKKTALEYELSMSAEEQYYDQEFRGSMDVQGAYTAKTVYAQYTRFMMDLGHFMAAKNMRLDDMTTQDIYNPRVLRQVQYGDTNATIHAATQEVFDKGVAYEGRDFGGDTTRYVVIDRKTMSQVHRVYALQKGQVYVEDVRVPNYFDLSKTAHDWFEKLETAYRLERGESVSYNNYVRNRMNSLIGFKNLHNFLGALILTKGQQNKDYQDALMRTINEPQFFDRVLGIATGKLAGTDIESRLAQDLVGLLSLKTGSVAELNRINITSYPLDKEIPNRLNFSEKLKALLDGSLLEEIGKKAKGRRTCKGLNQ